jgi:hypothetical protein
MKQAAAIESKSVSATSVVASVANDEPWTRRLTRKMPATSPPRAGTIALMPTRAKIAPTKVLYGTCASGYDAPTMFRQARLTQPSFTSWQQRASPSDVQPTAARWPKKTPMLCRTASIAAL